MATVGFKGLKPNCLLYGC